MISGQRSSSKTPRAADDSTCGEPAAPGELRIAGVERSEPLRFTFDGHPLTAYPGETVAVALWASGQRALRTTQREGRPRGIFCNMGVCFDCLVEIDGQPNQRACRVEVAEGMTVRTQNAAGSWDGNS